jgi:hypothetical protein
MLRGLLYSYSRGAWFGTFCGLLFLVSSFLQKIIPKIQDIKQFLLIDNIYIFSIILISVVVLLFWQLRYTDWHLSRRIMSITKVEDFSWRNRVSAWKGALEITADYPWRGVGWNKLETLYDHFYMPVAKDESAAIETNDYLVLSATLGIPAFFCFGIYLWLSLTQNTAITESDWIQMTCRAGAIVLLVGFWFDGGLLKLPTAAAFWILLELGATQLPQKEAIGTITSRMSFL